MNKKAEGWALPSIFGVVGLVLLLLVPGFWWKVLGVVLILLAIWLWFKK